MTKDEMRRASLACRDAIPTVARIEASLLLLDRLDTLGVEPGTTVAGYHPIRSEIDPRPLMDALRREGCRLALPVVVDRETMVFRELVRGAELVEAGFGTLVPGSDAAELQPDTLLVPLAAFDAEGNRIGYGAGYYDRYIATRATRPRLIGLAFEAQRVDAVPLEPHDVPLDRVLTEAG